MLPLLQCYTSGLPHHDDDDNDDDVKLNSKHGPYSILTLFMEMDEGKKKKETSPLFYLLHTLLPPPPAAASTSHRQAPDLELFYRENWSKKLAISLFLPCIQASSRSVLERLRILVHWFPSTPTEFG